VMDPDPKRPSSPGVPVGVVHGGADGVVLRLLSAVGR